MMIPYTLFRSRRKTIAIHITKDAGVEVRAPIRTAKADINRFVAEKENWIKTHLALKEQLNEVKAAFTLKYGDSVMLCGKPYHICAKAGTSAGFDGESFYIPPGLAQEDIKNSVICIYKLEAKLAITNKVNEYAPLMNVTPAVIRITNAKTRWGSCSGRNSINFSWRLIIADDDVIDYVVVHELAHIKEHNHSPRFWALVADVLPDYRERQDKLRLLQRKLSAQDWDLTEGKYELGTLDRLL
jgi:predicted metal-dependent hydrolase